MQADPTLQFACPACQTLLKDSGLEELACPADGRRFSRQEGIWRFLLPERQEIYRQFVSEYETVRAAEGRGAADPAYYRALPFQDLTDRRSADWRIRAASLGCLLSQVLSPMERKTGRPLTILDLGAGNGWLSNRLAQRGHQVAAVDLLDNAWDGLGAYIHYTASFTPVQAEFDHLPFGHSAVDLLIYNASFHYSVNYRQTLAEALRVLGPEGQVVVMDSPVYHDPASGAQMVSERQADFVRRYGFPSNALPSENYLTDERIKELAGQLGLHWRRLTPFYSLRWALRPWLARLRRKREPARFGVLVFDPENSGDPQGLYSG
jgi:SAM-dependent methyltransferase